MRLACDALKQGDAPVLLRRRKPRYFANLQLRLSVRVGDSFASLPQLRVASPKRDFAGRPHSVGADSPSRGPDECGTVAR